MSIGVGDFQFLALPEGECWDRRGTLQLKKGVKSEYYHHPEALRVDVAVIEAVRGAFKAVHPRFDLYYPTEFAGDELPKLEDHLDPAQVAIELADSAEELSALVGEDVAGDVEYALGPWSERWSEFRDLASSSLGRLIELIGQARAERMSLLAIGV